MNSQNYSQHSLDYWKQYVTSDDYNYLVEYIENIKNNISNDKMIVLFGKSRTGKSTLINHIKLYLGDEKCEVINMSDKQPFNQNIKKLALICGGIHETSKKNNTAILNLIKYHNQSFIADSNCIETINSKLLECSKIIKMEHVF